MTKILALDSSTDACSVALLCNGKISSQFEVAAKSHTQRLLPMVDEILQQNACELSDLNAIAFGRGPGSFTGLRICMGIVQGLAFGADLPVIGISTLQAMAHAYQAENPNNQQPILTTLDARMNEVYAGLFSADSFPQSLIDESVCAPQHLVMQIEKLYPQEKIVGLGSGWNYTELQALNCASVSADFYPNAKSILALAEQAWLRGESQSVLEAQPVYLRDSVSWEKRKKIRQT